MKKLLFLCLAGLVAVLLAAPAEYSVLGVSGTAPTIDGDLSDWDQSYFLDSLHSDDNCYYRDLDNAWTAADIQYEVYATWDASKVYFAVKVTADDDPLQQQGLNSEGLPKVHCSDGLKINPGGQSMAFYFITDGTFQPGSSCPFQKDVNAWAGLNVTGNGAFPTYEFALDKSLLDPFGMSMFQLSVGSEENDGLDCQDGLYMGLGAEYTGNKHDGMGNPWDNSLYYPSYTLVSAAVEAAPVYALDSETLTSAPNPFKPSTVISYNVKNSGLLKIFDLNGKLIGRFETKAGAGKVTWNANDLASGIYVARLTSGTKVLNTRLFLAR
jgi:hypothetical protein